MLPSARRRSVQEIQRRGAAKVADLIVTYDRLPLEARKVPEDHGSTVRIATVHDS